jgi:hypothetical protein
MRTLFLLLPLAAGAAIGLLWAWQADFPGLPQGAVWLAWVLCAAAVAIEFRRPCQGLLRWDGQDWQWEAAGHGQAGAALVRLDWQAGLLLEFRALDGRTAWLWPERRTAPLHWDALRRALYAPRPQAADGGGQTPTGGSP